MRNAHCVVEALGTYKIDNDVNWEELYSFLYAFARCLVFSLKLPVWRGQEDDIAQDIAQETALRLVKYLREMELKGKYSIRSLKSMAVVIARNYCWDLWRHDRRLLRLTSIDSTQLDTDTGGDQLNLIDCATENAFQEALFALVAREIVRFPNKQKHALLTDLANRMYLDTQPERLQKALLEVGIQLPQYQQSLPADPQEVKRYIALLYHAYKRFKGIKKLREYISTA